MEHHHRHNAACDQEPDFKHLFMDMESLQPSPSQVEAYELYLHLPDLTRLWRARLFPAWPNETLVRPALHSLELVFRLISSVLCDARPYIDRDEWLRRLESLANSELEIVGCLAEFDDCAPCTSSVASTNSCVGTEAVVWHKARGAKAMVSKVSKESLLPRLAAWRTAQSVSARLQFAVEAHMARAPFTLGIGEPNLAGKPVLEYDAACLPLEVYACRQSMPGQPEDHTLSTVHQIMEAWLEVASGLLQNVEEKAKAGNFESAAKSCWVVERVWKLLVSIMDLLQVMDPDDFMRLKEELAISQDGACSDTEHIGGGAYCLRSTRLRGLTSSCKSLRDLLPAVVGIVPDPKGGPNLQLAVLSLLHSHGLNPAPTAQPLRAPFARPLAYHSSTIHLLQSFQGIESAVRQFYFAYQQLVISVMGSGEYNTTGTGMAQGMPGGDVLSHIYFEPPYFPSLDGAKTFLGSYWHGSREVEEGALLRELTGRGAAMAPLAGHSSNSPTAADAETASSQALDSPIPKKTSASLEKKQYSNGAMKYNNNSNSNSKNNNNNNNNNSNNSSSNSNSNNHVYQGAMRA